MREMRIGDVMKRQVVTIGASDRLSTAEDIMTLGRVRHMPVVNAGRLVGVLSERDLLGASIANPAREDRTGRRKFLDEVEVASVMSAPATAIDAGATLIDAARIMLERRIGCLPVLSERGELLGMISESDLLGALARPGPSAAALEVPGSPA